MQVEVIGHFRLLLCTGFYLDLKDTFVVPSFNQVNLSLNSKVIRTSSLVVYNNLYMLDIVASYQESLNIESRGTKCKLDNAHSRALWHKHLGHISRNRVE